MLRWPARRSRRIEVGDRGSPGVSRRPANVGMIVRIVDAVVYRLESSGVEHARPAPAEPSRLSARSVDHRTARGLAKLGVSAAHREATM